MAHPSRADEHRRTGIFDSRDTGDLDSRKTQEVMDASRAVSHINWVAAVVAAIAGFMAGFTYVAAAFGITYLFEFRPFKLRPINAGYQVVVFSVMGVILGAWH
jgi:hypothetical protein